MGLKTWQLSSDENLTDDDRRKIANEIIQGSNGGMFYSVLENKTSNQLNEIHSITPISIIDDCKALIKQGSILAAVKFYKEETGTGLREAKDFIDNLREDLKNN
jgi:hypothetical protein